MKRLKTRLRKMVDSVEARGPENTGEFQLSRWDVRVDNPRSRDCPTAKRGWALSSFLRLP